MIVRPQIWIIALCCLLVAPSLLGADYHFTPTGAGDQSGVSFQHALPATKLQTTISENGSPGDRFLLGSGIYSRLPHSNNTLLVLTRGGTAENPVTLQGIDTGDGLPLIQGRWKESNVKYHAHSSTAISLRDGASHLIVRDLRIHNCMHGLKTSGKISGVQIINLTVKNCREGFVLNQISRSTFSGCRISHYTKRGFRFETGCHHLSISDSHADATAGDQDWPIEVFPFGFAIEGDKSNHDIEFIRCTARNNLHRGAKGEYWNGDGFVVESETRAIRYNGCAAYDNTDGGWDDKSRSPVFENCVAARNKRGFRIWNLDGNASTPARLTNCLGVFNTSRGGTGSSAGLWTRGSVVLKNCTFHSEKSVALAIENSKPGGHVVARKCLFSSSSTGLQEKDTHCEVIETITWDGGPPEKSPDYIAPKKDWSGEPFNAFRSRRYPDFGFDPIEPGPLLPRSSQ